MTPFKKDSAHIPENIAWPPGFELVSLIPAKDDASVSHGRVYKLLSDTSNEDNKWKKSL